jgi:archaeosine synthase
MRFRERVTRRFQPRGKTDCLLILPCSSRKPYSTSRSHRRFSEATRGARRRIRIREVILTSPLGAVPRELESVPPAGHYDIPVTGIWSEEEIMVTAGSLTGALGAYPGEDIPVIAHVADGYREVCQRAEMEMKAEFVYTGGERPTSPESLEMLSDALGRVEGSREPLDPLEPSRLVLSYQFGTGPGNAMVQAPSMLEKRGVNTSVERVDGRVARLNIYNGLYIPGPVGAAILSEMDVYCVDIDFELGEKVLYSPGVVSADGQIRPGDEVVIRREGSVVGQGRSILDGESMTRSDRGKAVVLRELF